MRNAGWKEIVESFEKEFEEILRTIGAKKSEYPIVLSDETIKVREGKPLTEEEVKELIKRNQSKNLFIDEGGEPYVLFIYDRIQFVQRRKGSSYKFHFMNCRTIRDMEGKGRVARYKGKYDVENPYFDSSHGGEDMLDVCKNCLNDFNFHGRKPVVSEFNILEFFDCYGTQDLRTPTHQGSSGHYTKNWFYVARSYKERQGWCCEKCQRSFATTKRLLHAHHINGVKDDNRDRNLKALCFKCHDKEHGGYFQKGSDFDRNESIV